MITVNSSHFCQIVRAFSAASALAVHDPYVAVPRINQLVEKIATIKTFQILQCSIISFYLLYPSVKGYYIPVGLKVEHHWCSFPELVNYIQCWETLIHLLDYTQVTSLLDCSLLGWTDCSWVTSALLCCRLLDPLSCVQQECWYIQVT